MLYAGIFDDAPELSSALSQERVYLPSATLVLALRP